MGHELDDRSSPTPEPSAKTQFGRVVSVFRELRHPTQIGPYFVQELIAEGGMGTVYRAEQREPIQRVVAVKVIKLGMDTREVIARFESERQALALMDHPNVAKVLDAGATDAGRPYFVMEFVKGEPITDFADRHLLPLPQRLELFAQACAAVQHAHQKAIIHRDLKPSNILVTLVDDKPQVKVIDFGVAKAVAQKLTERTLFTETGQLVGTPEYMAPEQAEGSTLLEADTRSDVYSLGVVLYELLAGALPFDPKTLRSAGFNEIQRIIRETDPPRPSTRLSKLGRAGQEVARLRATPLDRLQRQLGGELEWIPLKAMRKEPAQRYASAAEMAEDVGNYLSNRPLRAAPESRLYRARKFLSRNRVVASALAAVLVVLVGGIVATTWQAVRATRAEARAAAERDNAKATLEFLTQDVLSGATPENIPDAKVRDQIVSAMITPAATRVGEAFADRPLAEASVRAAIQTALREIGRSDLALPHAETALSIRRRMLGEDHPDTLASMNDYGRVLKPLGRTAEAAEAYRVALERRRRVLGEDHPDTISSMNNYAGMLDALGRSPEAVPLLHEALQRRRRLLGDDHPDTITSLNNYATALANQKRYPEAEKLHAEALERRRRVQGEEHPLTLLSLNNLAYVVRVQGRAAEAEPLYRRALEGYRRVMGEDHPATLTSLNNYAVVLRSLKRFDEAEPRFKQVLERRRRLLGANHPDTIWSLNEYGVVLRDVGRVAEGEAVAREAVASASASPALGPTHQWTKWFAAEHAQSLESLGRRAEATELRQKYDLPPPATQSTTHPATRPTDTAMP